MTRKFKLYDEDLKPEDRFYEVSTLKKRLAHNCDYTILSSPRAVGKSYSGMMLCSECLDKGENVVWERYNKVELGIALDEWMKFRPWLTKTTIPNGAGWKLIDETTGGHVALIPWNIAQNSKGLDDAYIWEVKDEFIPVRYTQKTRLDTEFDDAMAVRQSIIRKYPTRSIYFANCIQWINPYSVNWGLPPVDRGTYLKVIDTMEYKGKKDSRSILWENIAMTEGMIERTLHSVISSSRSQEEVDSYFDNATRQEYSRIEECPDLSVQPCHYQMMSQGYYMGYRQFEGTLYWFKTKPRDDIETFVSEPEYIDYERKQFRDPYLARQIEERFNDGHCAFDSPETLVALLRWLYHCRKRI